MTERRTDGTSAFNTRTEQRRLLLLDPARREGEVEEDSIQQQHNGVVVMEERGNPAGLRQAPRDMRRKRGRDAPTGEETHVLGCSYDSTIYRGKGEGGGAALPLPPRKGCG